MRKKFVHWLSVLNQELLDALVDAKTWSLILLTFVAIIAISSKAPIVSEFFHLQFLPSLLSLIPVAICAALISSTKVRHRLSWPAYGVLMLITSATFQFFMWSLVCFSELPGATLLAALPILLAAYHGEFFQFSGRYPWGGLATLAAISGAFLISPDSDHNAIIAVGGVIALGAAATMGNHAQIHNNAVKERDSLKAAIDAQTLLERVRDVERAQNVIFEIRGTNHDAGNALSGILMNLDLLSSMLSSTELSQDDQEELREMSGDISISTQRLRALIEQGRDAGKKADTLETVNITHVIQTVLDGAKLCYPENTFTSNIHEEIKNNDFIQLHGGELALHRVLNNLVINACEGNGLQSANKIHLYAANKNQQIEVIISDNGPGFKPEQLKQAIADLKTSKATGTGLGLYTSQRLIEANHGTLSFKNLIQGGAEITVNLPRQSAS